ncbi:MAG TPA: hypothetical protein VG841_06180 [Caulobacterales bacterium]|nr:hypothetical protein [Caulobacterales bacterium]
MRHWGAILCAVWCVLACVVVGVRTQRGDAFDTDIQTLLPQNALEPVIRAAIADAGGAASRRVVVLVSPGAAPRSADPLRAQQAAADLEHSLEATGLFTPDRADGAEIGRWLFANRNSLMCETDPAKFDAAAVVRGSRALLYAPIAPVSGEMLRRDPFLLTLQLAQCLSPTAGAQLGDATLVSGALNVSAFRIDAQDAVTGAYAAWRARWPDVDAARTGAVFYAADGAAQARNEISLIAGASTVAILVLLMVCFRRPSSIVGTLIATAVSGVGSLAATMLLFPSVHVLVFVFGSALIGVTSDYALHYLATGPQSGWGPVTERVKRVARPLAVCALSTSIGFASLGFFGVAFFNQVAVFSVAGVVTAWWFTLTLLPLFDLRARDPGKLTRWWDKLETPFRAFRWTRTHSMVGAIVLAVVSLVGAGRFAVLDDVRQFQPRSAALASEEARVREALGFDMSPSFLLSYGESAEAAREQEEAALQRMPPSAARYTLAASRFDPSARRRAENERVLRERLYDPHLAARVAELGLADPAPFASSDPAPPRPRLIGSLEGATGEWRFLVAPLGARAALEARGHTGDAILVDPAARYSAVFEHFRALATWAVAIAFAFCAVVVVLLYRTLRALKVLAAPAVGAAMAIAVPAALGEPISFFTISALFVVIGTGIDHSVFLFEAGETDGQSKELVVFLAVFTTILSMGLMAFSSSYPVRSFGIAVAAGVTAAYLFSFVPVNFRGSKAQ